MMRTIRLLPVQARARKPSSSWFHRLILALLLSSLLLSVVLLLSVARLLPTGRLLLDTSPHSIPSGGRVVSQRVDDLLLLWEKYLSLEDSSSVRTDAWKEMLEEIAHRSQVDRTVAKIGALLFGSEDGPRVLNTVRAAGKPLVDDWNCLSSMVSAYERQCGRLSTYGMRHTWAPFANMCNAGVLPQAMAKMAAQACNTTIIHSIVFR